MTLAQNKSLDVVFEGRLVGELRTAADGRSTFAYAREWLDAGFAISASLPLRGEPYGSAGHLFFANLLPEGEVRRSLVRRLGISEENDFELLRHIGGECAGALTVGDGADTKADYQRLDEVELSRIARDEHGLAGVTGSAGRRLSLAGAQDKLPVLVRDGTFFLPLGSSPSSHILKFENRHFAHLPANELFASAIAAELGLPTCGIDLVSLDGGKALLIERYDRAISRDHILRLHQEDLCQALGVSPHRKYEAEGGPSFPDCLRVVTEVSAEPAPDARALIRWLAFCAVVGNADGHAKNLSLLRTERGTWRLAPFYDLVCTTIYERLDRRLAMRVGDHGEPGMIRGRDWRALAKRSRLGAKLVIEIVDEMAGTAEPVARERATWFRDLHGDSPALQRVLARIRKQARRTRELLGE